MIRYFQTKTPDYHSNGHVPWCYVNEIRKSGEDIPAPCFWQWDITSDPPDYESSEPAQVGLLLNPEFAFSVLDKGPPAESPEVCCFLYYKLLFMTTLFRNFPEMNWFAATNFCYQALLSTPVFYYNCMADTGPRREIFATNRLLQTSHKFFAREWKLVYITFFSDPVPVYLLVCRVVI